MDTPTRADLPSPAMADHDQPSPAQFTMTVEEAVLRYAELGHPRNPRSIRRFCQQGTLDCRKIRNSNFTELYLIDPASIQRHVKEIAETISVVSPDTSGHDQTRPAKTGHDQTRPAKTGDESRYVALLEKVNADQAEQLKTKDEQLKIKDSQIAAMLERDRGTNFLIRGLQTLLGLPDRRGNPPAQESPERRDEPDQSQSTTS